MRSTEPIWLLIVIAIVAIVVAFFIWLGLGEIILYTADLIGYDVNEHLFRTAWLAMVGFWVLISGKFKKD